MYEDVIEILGNEKGGTSIILVGVHGNERCGLEAMDTLLPNLKIQKGRMLVAYGNPKAIKQNVRFTDVNLNRMFKPDETLSKKEKASYEYACAQFLKTYLDQAEVLLDIHESLTPAGDRSIIEKFIIGEEQVKNIAQYLPLSLMVSGFDQVQPGGTDTYMNQMGKIGICVECGYFNDAASTRTAEECINAFLVARGHVPGELQKNPQAHIQITYMYTTKNNFVPTKRFGDFEEVISGQIIGKDGSDVVSAQSDGVILFARDRKQANEEAFLFGHYTKKV